jgi:hypothetical protein
MDKLARIVILNPFHGLCGMRVCVEKDATDEEILLVCNRENPSGTTVGWSEVIRDDKDRPDLNPLVCAEDPNRLHIIVSC